MMGLRIRYVVRHTRTETYVCDQPQCGGATHNKYISYYTLPDGVRTKLKPGDVFYWECHEPNEQGMCHWDNCDGRHLHAVCPDGHHWNIDGRASNCAKKDDRLHRCWVRTGRPEDGTLHVGKGSSDQTCPAGGGSIDTLQGYHGHLQNGEFTLPDGFVVYEERIPMIDVRYREGVMVDELQEEECTIRACRTTDGIAWWELWMNVRRDDNRELLVVGVPVLPDGDARDPGAAPRTWGFKRGETADAWIVSPSVNVLKTRELHPGEHPSEESMWHQNVRVRDVPHDAVWIGRSAP